MSLGLIGAGTNNARIAGMLRNLSSYYYKDPNLLFCVWSLGFSPVHQVLRIQVSIYSFFLQIPECKLLNVAFDVLTYNFSFCDSLLGVLTGLNDI